VKTELPPFWEPLLKRYVKKTFYAGTRKSGFADREEFTEGDFRFFAPGVARLNAYFTSERGERPANYFNQKDLRSGYILYFLPVNALKVAALLSQISLPTIPLTILDLGSGPGTGMFGAQAAFPSQKIHFILIDQNRNILRDAESLHREMATQSTLDTIDADLTRGPNWARPHGARPHGASPLPRTPPADLILAVNLLSEIPGPRRLPLIEGLLRNRLKTGGKILIVEPALQRTTRELMELHDQILRNRSGFVYAPCLHQTACPMLAANRRDWCHATIEWQRPGWIERLDHLVGIRKDYLKCSYLLLGREPAPVVSNETWRVVSGHLNSKGKSELLLCGPGGLPELLRVTRLDRDRSEANRIFDEAQRGDLIEMPRVTRIKSEIRISKL